MKQILLLVAVYSLIINQSTKSSKHRQEGKAEVKQGIVIKQGKQDEQHPVLTDNRLSGGHIRPVFANSLLTQ